MALTNGEKDVIKRNSLGMPKDLRDYYDDQFLIELVFKKIRDSWRVKK